MKTVYVEIPPGLTDEELARIVRAHKSRTGAFHAELREVTDHTGRRHPAIAFYVPEKLRRPSCAEPPSSGEVEIPEGETILYGERNDTDETVRAFLERHRLSVAGMFYDEDAGSPECDYPNLQKALFFAGRRRLPLSVTRCGHLMDDLRFLGLLSAANARFHGIDFPRFNHATLGLFKALAQYKRKQEKQ